MGFRSALAAPQNLTELFAALDVDTTSAEGQKSSLILQRGDGLQVRHIPEILRFISDNSSKRFHIWGFEEPENSLEMASAMKEAQRFIEISKENNKQLFVTSHSPAFFTIGKEDATKIFVSKSAEGSSLRSISDDDHSVNLSLMNDNFYLPVISRAVSEAMNEVNEVKKNAIELEKKLAKASGLALVVEGVTDSEILAIAYRKIFGRTFPAGIFAAGGTSKMKSLSAEGAIFKALVNERKVLVLCDNDFEGRTAWTKASSSQWKNHPNGTHWLRLCPTPEYIAKMNLVSYPEEMYFFCIEDCFPFSVRKEAIDDGIDMCSSYKYDSIVNPSQKVFHANLNQLAISDEDFRLCVFGPGKDEKTAFLSWLKKRPASDFTYFDDFFRSLHKFAGIEIEN